MPLFFIYLLKLSVSLTVVYLFYQFILRKLTFYHSNRWYLLGYTLVSFIIPFINIAPILEKNRLTNNAAINWIPVLQVADQPTAPVVSTSGSYTGWTIAMTLLLLGMAILFLRIIIQWISFRRMLRKATLLGREGMKLYQVDAPIIPFSFGNSIFINRHQHPEQELEEIIRHEFVHVRQRHSIDIIWAEWLCLLNWYNPFAWLLRRAIRQNLEFIADHKVLEQGCNRKHYQYLLLRVMGNSQFSIATPFNFTSLKKRIAMMNKTKSAKRQLLRLLFLLPATAVLLLAFRNKWTPGNTNNTGTGNTIATGELHDGDNGQLLSEQQISRRDTVPLSPGLNKKGYEAAILYNNGKPVVSIRNAKGREVDRVLLSDWKKSSEKFESKYGELELPPAPPTPPVPPTVTEKEFPIPPVPPAVVETNAVSTTRMEGTATVQGETGTLNEVRVEPAIATTVRSGTGINRETVNMVEMSGKTSVNSNTVTLTDVKVANKATPVQAVEMHGRNVVSTDYADAIANGKEVARVTITNRTTRAELDGFIAKMKAKGVELSFDDIQYNNNGILEHINGTMRSGNTHGNFSGTEFARLVLSVIQKDGKTYFRILTSDTQEQI